MRVILLQDVTGVGQRYEVKEVKDGFARNFLIARGLAEAALSCALARVEKLRDKLVTERAAKEEELKNSFIKLSGQTFILTEPASDKGSLFASVAADKIAEVIRKETNLEMPKEFIKLQTPIKKVGPWSIELEGLGQKAEIKLEIKAAGA